MKNIFINKYKNSILISIKGRNINKFLLRMNKNNIDIIKVENKLDDMAIVRIYEKDYQKLKDIKTIYDINILDTFGIHKYKKIIKYDSPIILSIVVGLVLLIFLTNIIWNVEVIHDDKNIRKLVIRELKEYDIKKYHLVKSYDYIDQVKKDILTKYKDKIEWLEIERRGVNYYVRLETRKISDFNYDYKKRHIIAKKDAIIRKIHATHGVVEKSINNYVKKGDIIINGNIILNDQTKDSVKATGEVYGEVWYKVIASYPFNYQERIRTGIKNKTISLNFINKKYEIINLKKFQNKDVYENVIVKSNLIPISLSLDTNYEVEKVDEVLTNSEAFERAKKVARDKIESKLSDKETIMYEKVLNVQTFDSKIELEVFFAVYEDITDYLEIKEE